MTKRTVIPRPGQLLRALIKAGNYRSYLVDLGLDKNLDDLAGEANARQSSAFELMQDIEDACCKALVEDCGHEWAQFFRLAWFRARDALQVLAQRVDTSPMTLEKGGELFAQQFAVPMLSGFINLTVSLRCGGSVEAWLTNPLRAWFAFAVSQSGIAEQRLLDNLAIDLDADQRTIDRWLSGEPIGKLSWPYAPKVAAILGKKVGEPDVNLLTGGLLVACAFQSLLPEIREAVRRDCVLRKQQPWALENAIAKMNQEGYSPEQIAGTLAAVHPDKPSLQVSHETIYTAIYAMPRGELRTEVIGWLRFGHAKRRPRARGEDRRGKIPGMVSIHDRQPEVDERLVPGHWEGDLIKGAYNRSAVGTLVERTTLFTVLAKMDTASTESAVKGFGHVLGRIEAQKRLSMTYDQGREMAAHQQLTEESGVKVYFADPHSPWQRGINENTNGLLRQYLPKGTDLSGFTQDDLDKIAWQLNTRPRKSLGFKCPVELFMPDAFDFKQHHAALFALGT